VQLQIAQFGARYAEQTEKKGCPGSSAQELFLPVPSSDLLELLSGQTK